MKTPVHFIMSELSDLQVADPAGSTEQLQVTPGALPKRSGGAGIKSFHCGGVGPVSVKRMAAETSWPSGEFWPFLMPFLRLKLKIVNRKYKFGDLVGMCQRK